MCLMQDFRLSTSRAVSFGTAGPVATLTFTEWNGRKVLRRDISTANSPVHVPCSKYYDRSNLNK